MSWKRKSIDQHRVLRQSGLFKQRVVKVKNVYKRREKYRQELLTF